MTTSFPAQSNVFISYSHKDTKFAERLKAHLVTSAQEARVVDWTDTLAPGSNWREAIERSLETAKVAVLLVSADYLASQFVMGLELSPLLVRAQREEVFVVPVILRPCAFGSTDLARFQAFNSPSRPLTKMSRSEQESVWARLAYFVSSALSDNEPSLLLSSPKEGTLLTYRGHSREVLSVAWSPDRRLIASGSADNTVQIWEATTGKLIFTGLGHTRRVLSVAWSPDGRLIASGSADNTVQIWEATTGEQLLTYGGHTDWVRSVAWSPDEKFIASGSVDQTVQVWDAVSGSKLVTYLGHPDVVMSVAWSPNGKFLVSGGNDQSVQIWEASSGKKLFTYYRSGDEVTSVAWSPDGQRVASAGNDSTVQVWEVASGNLVQIYRGHSDGVNSLSWSSEGQRVASASNDKTVQVWQVR